MKKALFFVICDVFSSFSLLISGKEFQVEASLGSRSPFAFPAPFFSLFFQPLLSLCFSLPTGMVLLGTPREFPSHSSSLFFPQVLLHLLQIAFHSNVVHFRGANLTVPNVMPGSVFIHLLTVGCFHSEVLSDLPSKRAIHNMDRAKSEERYGYFTAYRIYAQNEREKEHENTHMVV